NRDNTSAIMLWVVIAMIPGIAAQLWFFGAGTLFQILIAVVTALVTESIAVRLRNQPVMPYLKDNSALVTAVLLAVSIPPLAPWWMIVIGTFFAVIIAKHIYGGLGQNPFNPAMVGYVVLLISFPVQMTSWLPPESLQITPVSLSDSLHVI
ncbi:RnfABCDGE type electron transport complex subunit D, partial [Vibrio alginolyticus]|nr:RnfABCDGE type electron transport complex subunit D [Vibrio alginolyticus]